MSNILYIGSGFDQISKIFDGHNVYKVYVPENQISVEKVKDNNLRLDLGSIDIIYCELINSIPTLLELIRNGYKKPIILVPHINPYPLRNLLLVLTFLQKTVGQSIIVCGSSGSSKIYNEFFGINPVVLPTYGIDKEVFCNHGKQLSRKILGLDSKSKIILYTGRIAPDKNIGGVFATYSYLSKHVQNLRLVISYKKKEDRYLQNLVSSYKPENLVLISSEMSQLKYVYSAADVFISCSTSYFETFGRSPLEANACHLPTIVPDWVGFNSYLNNNNSDLIDVDFFNEQLYDDKNYAMVDLEKLAETSRMYIENDDSEYEDIIEEHLEQKVVFEDYKNLIKIVLDKDNYEYLKSHINYTYKLNKFLEGLLQNLELQENDNVIDQINNLDSSLFDKFDYKELFYLMFKDKANINLK